MSMHEGLPVPGYRPQTTTAIDQVTENKIMEERLLRVIDRFRDSGQADLRWLAMARTDLERGFMALNRAIFQPARIALPEDAPPAPARE